MGTARKMSRFQLLTSVLLLGLASLPANAVPSFSRQTGRPCSGCHTIPSELTPYGREFKLGGFVDGDKLESEKGLLRLPLSVSGVIADTVTSRTSDQPDAFPHDRDVVLQDVSIYYAGRIVGNLGALVQYKYEALDAHWGTEMADIRYGNSTTLGGDRELLYGFTLNNNPTIADVYNSTPMWGSPHLSSSLALMPNAAAIVDNSLMQQVGGLGAYARWNGLVYAEFAVYRKATGILHPFSSGTQISNVVDGNAPYWRLALQYEAKPYSFEVGMFGLNARIFPDATQPFGATDQFRDLAADAQFQCLKGDHAFSAHATYIHEKQNWDASFAGGMVSNPTSTLRTTRVDMSYSYRHSMGGTLQYFSTSGDTDVVRYDNGDPVMGSRTGSPNTSGWLASVMYLPVQNVQLGLQYIAYDKFNGAGSDYSGSGRKASDNNTLYAYAWVLY